MRLETRGLSLERRLFDVSLSLPGGQLACLVGPNGSGKTSLLHAIAGIGKAVGDVTIEGVVPRTLGPARRIHFLTFLPATKELRWPLRARDLIALGGGTSAEVAAVIDRLELGAVAERRADSLSTGERSRVLIARALAPQPKLLLLDEPAANLDPLWQIRLMDMLKEQLSATGQSALVAMHDLDAAARYGDRMIVMAEGRIAADGPPPEILAGPHIPQVFGIEQVEGEWRPAVRRTEDPRSSR